MDKSVMSVLYIIYQKQTFRTRQPCGQDYRPLVSIWLWHGRRGRNRNVSSWRVRFPPVSPRIHSTIVGISSCVSDVRFPQQSYETGQSGNDNIADIADCSVHANIVDVQSASAVP